MNPIERDYNVDVFGQPKSNLYCIPVRCKHSIIHILTSHLTTLHCSYIPLPYISTDRCSICRPHSDPVGCSWFQTTQCDTSGGPSQNPLILRSHHWGSSKVLSLIAHVISCSNRHLGPRDRHCCSISSCWCRGLRGGCLQVCYCKTT